MIGERVRDKIAASKAKGLWVGGPVPLGYACIDKKLEVAPEEAETVRMIFNRYLELNSVGLLVQELDRAGIRTKRTRLSQGRVRGGIRFGVGSLAYLLKNRFYICEVVYRGKIHRGEHEAIVDRALFEAVQAKLVNGAASRHLRLKASPAILAGRLHDDRGNRMTPTHADKKGARYRYYVSHALLQKRRNEAGAVLRVSVPDIERVVIAALREIPDQEDGGPSLSERDLVERHVERIVVRKEAIEIQLSSASWRRWPLSRRGS